MAAEYAKYLDKKLLYENQQRGKIQLDIELINSGTLPAEDVDIYLHFPDGFELIDNEDVLEEPEEPKILSFEQYSLSPLRGIFNSPNFGNRIASLYSPHVSTIRNVSSPRIRRVHSYDVDFNVRRLKHNQKEPLDPLYSLFDSFEAAQSFSIDYKIQAGNVPMQIDEKLKVEIIKKYDQQ
jgi:hypothetical protein